MNTEMRGKKQVWWTIIICIVASLASCSFIQDKKGASWKTIGAFCKDRMDGRLYEDPTDCRGYIYCSGGYSYRAQCDKGLYYDHKLQACNYDYGECDGKGEKSQIKRPQHTLPKETRYPDDGKTEKEGHYKVNSGQMIIEKYTQRNDYNINLATKVSNSACMNRPDGTYPHPQDCRAYIVCSNGMAYPANCPKGLIYSRKQRGCDFDIEEKCPQNKDKTKNNVSWKPEKDRTETYDTTSPRYGEPDYVQSPHDDNGYSDGYNTVSGLGITTILPQAVESAMTSLMKKLEGEAKLASHMSDTRHHSDRTVGRRRPFKMVQKFLKAKPLAKHLSLSGFIITNATYILIDRADDTFPKPEPGVCPWPKYNCEYSKYRSIDGSCNNLQHPLWGRSFTPLQRFLPPSYGDMMSSLRRARDGSELPEARKISFTISTDENRPHYIHTTMLLQWGQFVDHDLALTAISKISTDPSGFGQTVDIECGRDGCDDSIENCHPIRIPRNDPAFRNKQCLEFVRSEGVPDLDCSMGARQQLDQLTSFHDGSMIYGSTADESQTLRDFELPIGRREQLNEISSYIDASIVYESTIELTNKLRNLTDPNRGRLRVTPHPGRKKDLLPTTTEDEDCNEVNPGYCFLGGDERVNEQTALTAMHTIWMREHNRIEEILHSINRQWNGETLFQETRRIIGAMIQHITYNEFLPIVLGAKIMDKYELILEENGYFKGYDSSLNPSVANSFATAAYRFGHTLLVGDFKRLNNQYAELQNIQLSEMFFRPGRLMDENGGEVDGFARGLCSQAVEQFDRHITEEVTTRLFAQNPPNGLGTDLISLNIQRGRDHGVPGYNEFRKWCGLGYARDFDDLIEIDPATRKRFSRLYKHVDDIDLFPAGISERAVEGGLVGPTFACIIGTQFRNIRKGDRFWYENAGNQAFTLAQLRELKKASLAKVVCDNSDDISIIQERVMEMPFREAFPSFDIGKNLHGLNIEWFARLWTSDYNHRLNCSCLPEIDLSKWREGSR